MNSYQCSCTVRDASIALVVPWLESRGWKLTPYTDKDDQQAKGDYMGRHTDEGCKNFEMKAEQRWTGNLFLEEWSNRTFDPKYRKLGWMFNLTACDYVVYHFLDTGDAYIIDMANLRKVDYPKNQWRQIESEQRNTTCGFLVSLPILEAMDCIRTHEKIGQRNLLTK
jgi:hypothetical protein